MDGLINCLRQPGQLPSTYRDFAKMNANPDADGNKTIPPAVNSKQTQHRPK
jgi:hypothetical protein